MKKFIGDKAFYSLVLSVAIPIMVQSGITNFVSLLDNIMVGQIGTEQMSGVAIVNQLVFVFNLFVFGACSGIGIFSAQFFGQRNIHGVRDTFRFKFLVCLGIAAISIALMLIFPSYLISLFLHEGSADGDLALTLKYGLSYVKIMVIGFVPFALTQVYSGTLRECKQTVLPMKAGIAAVVVNAVFNYFLIFGKCGFPMLGVRGAAIATVISRFVELITVMIGTHSKPKENAFIIGVYKKLTIPARLALNITRTGFPLLLNEALWAMGMAVINQIFSLRGLAVISAMSIMSTLANVFGVVFMSLGSSVGIIVGNLLGAGEYEKAKDYDTKLIAFSTASCFLVGALMAGIGRFFPYIYNTTSEVKALAASLIVVVAAFMPLNGFIHAAYFTLRCGGKTLVTFMFDSMFLWVVGIPCTYLLVKFTSLGIVAAYALSYTTDILKCIIGFILVHKGVWINNLLASPKFTSQ